MTLLASRFLTPYEVSEDIGFPLSVPVLLSIWLLFLTSPLTLTRKSGCDIKLLSNLVKLLQMFCVCVTSFLVCQSLCLYLACYIISVTPNYSESLKKVKFNWGPKILFVGGGFRTPKDIMQQQHISQLRIQFSFLSKQSIVIETLRCHSSRRSSFLLRSLQLPQRLCQSLFSPITIFQPKEWA